MMFTDLFEVEIGQVVTIDTTKLTYEGKLFHETPMYVVIERNNGERKYIMKRFIIAVYRPKWSKDL